jgi:hypothetical protein
MKDIVAAAAKSSSSGDDVASPKKRAKTARSTTADAASVSPLSAADEEKVKTALDTLSAAAPRSKDESSKTNDDTYPVSSTALVPTVPESFPGPYLGERHRFGYGGFGGFGSSSLGSKAKKDKEALEEKKDHVESFLAPLVGYDGKEVGVTKKTTMGVWKVATLAGLWMFKGLDEEIDKVRDVVWQGSSLLFSALSSFDEADFAPHRR